MGTGDVHEVGYGTTDLHCVDTGGFDVEEYIAVYVLNAERPAVVETGLGTNHELVLDALETVGIAPEELAVIAPTHVHLDHAGGAGYLAEACPNAEVVVPEQGARHLIDPGRLWEGTKRAVGEGIRFYAEPKPVPESRVRAVADGDRVDLGDHELRVHEAPGHAPHQAVYFDPENGAAFTGDAAGVYVPEYDRIYPTTPPSNFDPEQAVADTRMVAGLDPEVLCYGHFGAQPTGGKPERHVEVLTEWVEAVRTAREELGDDEAVVERFLEGQDLTEAWGRDRAEAVVEMDVRGVLLSLDRREG
jgi:glyoxylase-like metal-dependent hydrolase (beta-lactamase superfamily II)